MVWIHYPKCLMGFAKQCTMNGRTSHRQAYDYQWSAWIVDFTTSLRYPGAHVNHRQTFHGTGRGGGGSAILDLWRHFRPPSWICGDVTSGRHLGFPVTWFPVTWLLITWHPHRKSRDRKSKMATASDVTTNPRWRPEVTSQIQDGGPTTSTTRPMKCATQVLAKVSLSDQEVRIILFCLQFLSMDFFYIWHR